MLHNLHLCLSIYLSTYICIFLCYSLLSFALSLCVCIYVSLYASLCLAQITCSFVRSQSPGILSSHILLLLLLTTSLYCFHSNSTYSEQLLQLVFPTKA